MRKFTSDRGVSSSFQIEQLEGRRLLSGAMCPHDSAADVLESAAMPAFTTQGTLTKTGSGLLALSSANSFDTITYSHIHGRFTGTYVNGSQTFNMSLRVSPLTHTGHFTGSVTFQTGNTTVDATFAGKITARRHVTVNFTGSGFAGTLDGKASINGHHITGNYSISGVVNSTGTFRVDR